MFNLERHLMKKFYGVVLFAMAFLVTTYAMAQVYDHQSAAVKEPMDRVVKQHAAVYANIGIAGEDEDALSQSQRYSNMIEPVNQAIDNHFNAVINYTTTQDVIENSIDLLQPK